MIPPSGRPSHGFRATIAAARPYLLNCLWLTGPVLAFDAIFTARLPPMFQYDAFWRDIPLVIAVPENLFRTALFAFMALMPIGLATPRHRAGMMVFLLGVLAYFASWLMQIYLPDSAWSVSAAGRLAPAYTPLLWLAGIGLVGDRLSIRAIPLHPWGYAACAILFLAFHIAHTLTVFWRYH